MTISSGADMAPHPRSVSAVEVQQAINRGLTVISSIGNQFSDRVESITFPAQLPAVISVGGYEPFCEGDLTKAEAPYNGSRYAPSPVPLSSDRLDRDRYCGYTEYHETDCEACSACTLSEQHWDGNVSTDGLAEKPDVYAPVMYPAVRDGQLRPHTGTSYAAPIVTALLVRVLSALGDTRDPTAHELTEKITNTGTPLSADDGVKPAGLALHASLDPSSINPFAVNPQESE